MSLEKKEERGSLKDLGKIKVRTVHYWPVDQKRKDCGYVRNRGRGFHLP